MFSEAACIVHYFHSSQQVPVVLLTAVNAPNAANTATTRTSVPVILFFDIFFVKYISKEKYIRVFLW